MNPASELMHVHPAVYSGLLLLTGTTGTRVLIYVSKQMPPLPSDAGFWATWLYRLMKGASGLDPNKSLVNPHILIGAGVDRNILRAAGVDETTLKGAGQ